MKARPTQAAPRHNRTRTLPVRGPVVATVAVLVTACGQAEDAVPGSGSGGPQSGASAETPVAAAGSLEIFTPRVPRPPAGGQAAFYVTVRNRGATPDTLVSMTTPAASGAAVHASLVEGGVVRMSPAGLLEVPPGGALDLTPGGLHGMLTGLVAPLEVGDTLRIILTFTGAGDVEVDVPVVTYADLEGTG